MEGQKYKWDIHQTNMPSTTIMLLGKLWQRAPAALKPSILPCFGHVLRRHFLLLQSKQNTVDGMDGPLQIFRQALCGEADQRTAACDALAAIFSALEAAAQEAPSSEGDWEAAVARATKTPAASEVVQRLSTLQPEFCLVLRDCATDSTATAATGAQCALQALSSMARLGVLHPASLVPELLAITMSHPSPRLRALAGKLFLRVSKSSPQVLMPVGSALRQAASNHSTTGASFGAVAPHGQWFTAACQAYSEVFDSKKTRRRFLRVVIDELVGLTGISGAEQETKETDLLPGLWKCELLMGLIVRLPVQTESELGDVLRTINRCLTLRVLPVLQDAHSAEHFERDLESRLDDHAAYDQATPCFYAGAMLMNALFDYMCTAAGDTVSERVLAGEAPRLRREECLEDRPLPVSFFKRQPPEFVGLILSRVAAASSRSDLLDFMVQEIPMDCRAFCGGPTGERKSRRVPAKASKMSGPELNIT